MRAHLYDHRNNKFSSTFCRNLGKGDKITINERGDLRIGKTDYLYSLLIHLSPPEMENLREKLNELYEKKERRRPRPLVLIEAEEILKRG